MTAATRQDAPLDARDRRLIELMVAGHTQQQCAEQLAINRSTVMRRSKRRAFRAALGAAEADTRRTARRKIAASLTTAADVLVRHALDDRLPPMVRVAAAGRLMASWAALEPRQHDVAASISVTPGPSPLDRIVAGLQRTGARLADDPVVPDGRVPASGSNGDARA
jgi:hypothetical protein